MNMLTKAQILEVNDIDIEILSVPEWKGDVKVKMMSGSERDLFESSIFEQKGKDLQRNMNNLRAKLISKCLIGEDGNRLFSDKEIDLLGRKSAKALDRIYEVCVRLNGIGAKEIEELTKNSESEAIGVSSITSPEN